MFTILHGDNLLASRKALEAMKKTAEKKEVISFDGKKVTLTDLKQALEARSLFGQEKLVIVENLISNKKKQTTKNKKQNKVFEYLKNLEFDVDLILWEKKKVDGRTLTPFKNAKVQLFQTPAIIFKFLESIQPDNQESMLSLFGNCVKTGPVELIFYMIVRQFRLLILVKDLGKEGVRMAPWQYAKLTNQANWFTLEKLLKIYKKLLQVDLEQKTGQSAFDLKKATELLLINLG